MTETKDYGTFIESELETVEPYVPNPLMVSVDFNDLVIRFGNEAALEIIRNLKEVLA